jgi:hypothetical protein
MFFINHALKFKYQPDHLKVKPRVMNHEQQVGSACDECILMKKACLFAILLQSIHQEKMPPKVL